MNNNISEKCNYVISKTQDIKDFEQCATIMSSTDPWIKLDYYYEKCLKAIQEPLKEIYVVRKDSQIIAFTVIVIAGAFKGYVQTLCVARDFRNLGFGTILLKHVEERIFKEFPNVFICVSSFNDRAHKLYNSLGYEDIGLLKDYVIQGHSEYLLRKTIAALNDFVPQSN